MIFLWMCIIVHGIPGMLLAQDLPADITQSMLVLLQEETTLRTKLEQDMAELGKELNTLKALKNNVTCECPWHTQPVAFSATFTQDITSLGVRQQVPFDKIITNIGNSYDSRHGEFRAPVTGTYEFSVSMLMNPGHWAGVEIVKGGMCHNIDIILNAYPLLVRSYANGVSSTLNDGVAIAKIRTGDSKQWTMAGTSVTTEMIAGEDVWVQHIAESDSNVFYGQSFSTFSGHLIQP